MYKCVCVCVVSRFQSVLLTLGLPSFSFEMISIPYTSFFWIMRRIFRSFIHWEFMFPDSIGVMSRLKKFTPYNFIFFYPCRVHMFRRIVRVLCPSVPCRVSCLCPWYLDNVSYGIQPVYLSLTLFTHQHSCIFTFGTIYTDQSFDIVTQIHCIHILYMYAE